MVFSGSSTQGGGGLAGGEGSGSSSSAGRKGKRTVRVVGEVKNKCRSALPAKKREWHVCLSCKVCQLTRGMATRNKTQSSEHLPPPLPSTSLSPKLQSPHPLILVGNNFLNSRRGWGADLSVSLSLSFYTRRFCVFRSLSSIGNLEQETG